MAVEVRMPQLGESVHEGTVGRWLKAEGDAVARYEPLLEVITDKVDTEVTAAEGGTLLRILVAEGTTVTVGTVLALIGEAGEAVGAASAPSAAPASTGAAGATAPGPAPAPEPTGPASEPAEPRVSPVAARMAAEHGLDPRAIAGTGPGGKVKRSDVERALAGDAAPGRAATVAPSRDDIGFISPRVARLAAQHGVDLRAVPGTGRDGRITARDVEDFVAARDAAPAAEPAVVPAATPAPAPAVAASVPAASAAPAGPPVTRSAAPTIVGELLELTPMRRAIADHMVRSKQTSPHVATIHEADMSAVLATHRALKEEYAARGDRLTVTALIVSAVARAIAAHPLVNSSWTAEGIRLHRDVNIGMAVAIPGGLIVPVIRGADEKSLVGISRDINDLAERARSRRLSPDDVQGGTFTITNYGTLGSLFGTPVINQPQAAILGTGAIKKRVVVVEGPDGDQIAIRPMMYLALTFDHRILDGGTADPFMRTLIDLLERFEV